MRIAVVILNWNTRDFLAGFLPGVVDSARAGDGPHTYDVVVADNGSSDGSAAFVKENFPSVKVLEFKENSGFTGGYNKALGLLEGYDCFLLLNSDIEVPQGWLQPLADFMEDNPCCGVCAPKLHAFQDRESFEYAGAAGGYIDKYGFPFARGRVLKWLEKDTGQFDETGARVFWATGACMLVRCSLWRELGGLDSRFFAHMEEIDFCWRAQLAGYTVNVVTEAVVYHVGGGTLPASSARKLKFNYRNNLLMLRNNLAKTLALDYLHRGLAPEKAARKGRRKAARRILGRMVLDGASAAVFLLTGRFREFATVLAAHKEYRKLKTEPSAKEIEEFLKTCKNASVTGVYRKCMPVRAIVFRKRTFFSIFAS